MSPCLLRTLLGFAVVTAALLAPASPARARTIYVAADGADGAACGPKRSPCRSITRGIANAVAGDKVIVGPGIYSSSSGENGAPGCDCLVAIDKAVRLESSHGAAQTLIRGRSFLVNRTVLANANGGAFGKPGKGFLVTQSGAGLRHGIVIDADGFSVRGNQFIPDPFSTNGGLGISTVDSPGAVHIEGNQVLGWSRGIALQGENKTVRGNVVVGNFLSGITASTGSVLQGNVIMDSDEGIVLVAGPGVIKGNAVSGNDIGISASNGVFTGTITKNNILNNGVGLQNRGIVGLLAAGNYWGAPTGPGPDPADDVLDLNGGVTDVSTFATRPFNVKPKVKP